MSATRQPWPVVFNRRSPQAKGLVAWYPCTPLGRSLRGMVRGRDLDITGGTWTGWQPRCGGGQSLLFNGSSDYARGTDVGLPTGSDPFSLTAWFRGDVSQDGVLVAYGSNVMQQQCYLAVYEVGFGIKDIITGNAEINLRGGISGVDGVEHLAVGTWDGTTLSLYVDGVLVDSSTATGFNLVLSGVFAVGSDFAASPGQFYAGRIADVRVYDYALSPAMVRSLWKPATRWELYAGERRGVVAAVATGFDATLFPWLVVPFPKREQLEVIPY